MTLQNLPPAGSFFVKKEMFLQSEEHLLICFAADQTGSAVAGLIMQLSRSNF